MACSTNQGHGHVTLRAEVRAAGGLADRAREDQVVVVEKIHQDQAVLPGRAFRDEEARARW